MFCKSSEEQKIKHLFDLYVFDDMDPGISYEGFLCILRNYPQDKIGTLTSDYGIPNMVHDAGKYQSVSDIRSKFKNIKELLDENNDKVYTMNKEELEMEEMIKPIGVPVSEYLNKSNYKEDIDKSDIFFSEITPKPNRGSVRHLTEERGSGRNLLSRRSSMFLGGGTNVAATNLDNKIKAYAAKVMEEYGNENSGIDFPNFRKFIKNHKVILDQFMVIFQEMFWTETHDESNRPVLGYTKMYSKPFELM